MRAGLRMLASVQKGSKFLQPGTPTGLTGLLTHSSPRSTLLYLYNSTLDKLKEFPESSVYRQSAEALTKHRMTIVENVKPAGLEEWQQRVASVVDAHPEAFKRIDSVSGKGFNIVWKETIEPITTSQIEDRSSFKSGAESKEALDRLKRGIRRKSGIVSSEALPEGPRDEDELAKFNPLERLSYDPIGEYGSTVRIESEPSLTAEQVGEIENKIGAGLIEEIIVVAEGEKQLAETLHEAKAWEDLEEKPAPGQWQYNERDTHTSQTQSP